MPMHPVAVHCPNCGRKVTVQPTVRSVVREGGSVTVNYNTAASPHHCGDAPIRVGFAPREGGQS
jgi:hypothetical protein